jgi:hypothetical protein
MATSIIYLISCCFISKKNKDITYSKWGTCGVELRLSEEGNLEFCSSVISNKQIIWVSNFGGALNLPEIKDLSGRHFDLVKILLAKGAHCNVVCHLADGKNSSTPLYIALEKGYKDLVHILY